MPRAKKPIKPPPPIEIVDPPEQPSLLPMVFAVAGVVAVVILVFSVLGFMLGKFIF
jgi:hypothetical protein